MMNAKIHRHERTSMLKQAASPLESTGASLREVVLDELKLLSLPRKRVAAGTLVMRPETVTENLYLVMGRRHPALSTDGRTGIPGRAGPPVIA